MLVDRALASGPSLQKGTEVVGWGARGSFMGRDKAAANIAREIGITFHCLECKQRCHSEATQPQTRR